MVSMVSRFGCKYFKGKQGVRLFELIQNKRTAVICELKL